MAVASPHVPTLLPPGKTRLEYALEEAVRPRIGSDVIRQVWDPWACPLKLLPWLAWAFSVDYWEDDWSEDQKRSVIARSFTVHRRKGTIAAMREPLVAFGFSPTFLEWWELEPTGVPGTALLLLNRTDNERLTAADRSLVEQVLDNTKRATLHINILDENRVRLSIPVSVAARHTAWRYERVRLDAPTP